MDTVRSGALSVGASGGADETRRHAHTPRGRRRPTVARTRRHLLRTGVAAALAMAATAGLAACGERAAPESASTGASLPPAKLRFMGLDAATDVAWHEATVKRFMERYPQVQVTLETRPLAQTTTLVTTQLAAGDPPDVLYQAARYVLTFYHSKALLGLDDLLKRERTLARTDFYPHALDDQSWRGGLFGMPTTGGGTWLQFNLSQLTQVGKPTPLELERAGRWTWAAFLDTARAVSRDSSGKGKTDVWGYALSNWDGDWPGWIWQNGGEILDKDRTKCLLDQPAAVEALEWCADLRLKHGVAPKPEDTASQPTTFDAGNVAMSLASAPGLQALRRAAGGIWTFDVTAPPAGKRKATVGLGAGTSIFTAGKSRDHSWRFVVEQISDPAVKSMVEINGRMPMRISQFPLWLQTLDPANQPPKNAAVMRDLLQTIGRTIPYTPTWDAWRKVIEDDIFGPLWRGQATAAAAVKTAVPKINQLLASEAGK